MRQAWTATLFGLWLCELLVSGASLAGTQDDPKDFSPGQVRILLREDVEGYLLSHVFKTPQMIALAKKPGSSVWAIVQAAAKRPLTVFDLPKGNPLAVSNHPAYLSVLSRRPYADPFVSDLYHLHELQHITTLVYEPETSYDAWAAKMIGNEKDASLYTEAWFYFENPELRALFPLKDIWVDRFLQEKVRLDSRRSNSDYYQQDPRGFKRDLLNNFVGIGKRPYDQLDALERRSWIYDRWNKAYVQTYAAVAQEIEAWMYTYTQNASVNPRGLTDAHLAWLKRWGIDTGVMFPEQSAEFFGYHDVLDTLVQNGNLMALDALSTQDAATMDVLVSEGLIDSNPAARELLAKFGVSTTVYSTPYLESETVTMQQWSGQNPQGMLVHPTLLESSGWDEHGLRGNLFLQLFAKPYTKRQDVMHQAFIQGYRDWSRPVLEGLDAFQHGYPTAGSIEAMKDTLGLIKSRNPDVTLHLFDGEYEGAVALAEALSIRVQKHDRTGSIPLMVAQMKKGDTFYISQPSSLDGNVWRSGGIAGSYTELMNALETAEIPTLVDLAYVGTVSRPYGIKVDYKNVEAVFFSLSKAFGVYYQRIGGVFTRKPHPMLVGHKWFKNLPGISVGRALMAKMGVYFLPRQYQWAQDAAVLHLREKTGLNFVASDALLLANLAGPKPDANSPLRYVFRGPTEHGFVRPALSPMIEMLVQGVRQQRPRCEIYMRSAQHQQESSSARQAN